MPHLDLIAQAAYEQGQALGGIARWAALLASTIVLVRRIVLGRYGRGLKSPLGTFAGLAVVVGLLGYSGYYDVLRADGVATAAPSNRAAAAYIERTRTDMVAGCVNAGSTQAYCGCVTEQVITRMGSDAMRMQALDAEMTRMTAGSQPPAVITQSAQACAASR